jgi:hypothetical protein
MLSDANYSSYALPLSGGTMTGAIVSNATNQNFTNFTARNTSSAGSMPNHLYYYIEARYNSGSNGTNVYHWVRDNFEYNITNNYGDVTLGATASGSTYISSFRVSTDSQVYATNSFRAPIFYDSQNTAYYLDPNNFSNLYSATFNSTVNFSSTTIWFGGYGPGSGPGMQFENQGSFLRMAFWGLDFYDWNNGRQMLIDGNYIYVDNYLQAGNSLRAPIFYDSNDTSYYLDPNGNSNLYTTLQYEAKARKSQSDNNYTTAALWTESFSNTTTGIAFHISGVVGKFLEMRTNGVLYWENGQVWTSGNDGSGSGLDADTVDGLHASNFATRQDGTRYSTNFNSILSSGFFNAEGQPANAPNAYGQLIVARGIDTGLQIAGGYNSQQLWFRGWGYGPEADGFYPWRRLLNDGADVYAANMNQYVRTTDTVTFAAGIFTNDVNSRVLYLRGSGNIVQFQDADTTSRWEIVGRNGTFYVYKSYGTGAGYKWQIDDSGQHTINGLAYFNNSVTAPSFFESSDMRIKELIEDNYKADGIEAITARLYKKNGKIEVGYYAQDVQGILPSAVSAKEDGYLNLSYREVHTAKIAYLENKIKQLEEKLNSLY